MIRGETLRGAAIAIGDREIIPVARFYRVGFPAVRGTLIWGTPHAVLIKSAEGGYDILRVSDRTREYQIGLIMLSLMTAALTWLVLRTQRENL